MTQIRRAGDLGVLIELEPNVSFEELHDAAAAAKSIPGVAACIVGHSSLYLIFESAEAADVSFRPRAERGGGIWAADAATQIPRYARDRRTHRIEVNFAPENGPDLDLLLNKAALSREQFLSAIASIRFRARYLGFRAGFAYLEGLPGEWTLTRHASPRVRVPAGTFATAAGMAAFYPSESPGGWNLLGRASATFWDPAREQPNLISAGDEVWVIPTDEPIRTEKRQEQRVSEDAGIAEVLRQGQLTLIVGPADVRRYQFGLPLGGPFDVDSAVAANRAVGNHDDATVLECAMVGPQLMFNEDAVLSWYGANAEILVDDDEVQEPRRFEVRAGDVVTIVRLHGGMRGYLAIGGGFVNPAERYTVTPSVLTTGATLQVAGVTQGEAQLRALRRGDPHVIGVVLGPHEVESREVSALLEQLWEVTPALDRTGIRFRPVHRLFKQPADLPSCGMQSGSVQWHPNGELVAVGPDHPITGGYLQPMTVISTERWKLAQLAPGDRVRWVTRTDASHAGK